jgi:hypothetical protein
MNPQELYESYLSVYESDDRREMRRLASQERQAEKKAESEFRSKSGIGAKKKGPKLSATKMSKGEGEHFAKQTMKDAEYIAKKAKGHTVGNPFPEEFDVFDQVLSELIDAGYTAEEALEYMVQEAYLEVYQEIDEAITSEKGKAKAAEMIAKRSTPSGRAKSGQGASVAAIKHISRSDKEGLGGTPMTPTMAKNPVKKRTMTGVGTGNKAARRAAALKKEDYVDEAQYARNNPEKYEREQEKNQSSRERRMNDPKTGINSKSFNDFYNAQMASKKKKASN